MNRRLSYLFVLLSVLLVGLEIVAFDVYHEEPRRLLVAVSMLEEGHWWVPHVLGEVYLKKPPGFNWIVALVSWFPGRVSRVSGRLVAVAGWLGTGALVGWMARDLNHRAARRTAVAAFLFAPVVFFEKAGLAELDLWFTFLLTAGLVIWFAFWRRGRYGAAWASGHLFLALALLTKGPVAYLFFYLPIGVWLFCRSESPRPGRLLGGILLGHGVVALWAGFLFQTVEPGRFLEVVLGELGRSSGSGTWFQYVLHLLEYPLQILLAMLPWGFLGFFALDAMTRRSFVKTVRGTPTGSFVAAGFTPILVFWLYPDDTVRYVLPVFPWLALMVGLVVASVPEALFRRGSAVLLYAVTVLYVLVLLVYPNVAEVEVSGMSPSAVWTASYLLASGGILMMVWLSLHELETRRFVAAGILFTVLLKAAYMGVYLPVRTPDVLLNETTVQNLIRVLPRETRRIRYNANYHLEVPYYFRKRGFTVRKGVGGDPAERSGLTIVARRRHYRGPPSDLVPFDLPAGSTFYLAVHEPSQPPAQRGP